MAVLGANHGQAAAAFLAAKPRAMNRDIFAEAVAVWPRSVSLV